MPVTSLGDMAQQFTSMRNSSAIKTELARLSESLSTGQVTDITTHLGGETARFAGLQYSLTQLDAYAQVASETQQYLSNVQIALEQVDSVRDSISERLLLVNDASISAQIDEAASSARASFETIVSNLNTQVADRALFGGANVQGPPLAPVEDMLAAMIAAIGGATDQATIVAAVETWFDDPAGGFATMGYLGDTGPAPERRVSETRTFEMEARADDPAVIAVLKGAALAALADDLPALDREAKSALLQDAGSRLFVASIDLVGLQASVGFTEAGVEQSLTETTAQQMTLGILQNDMIGADEFETASQLQSVRLQLETHYTVTVRLSQLSLLRYI